MLSILEALFAPVNSISQSHTFRAFLTSEYSFREVNQAFVTCGALHESLGNKLVTILGRALSSWHLLFLKSMRVSRVSLVALHAEGEVFTPGAVESIHLLRDWLHALITAEPQFKAIIH